MRDISVDPFLCSVDPITLGAIAIGALAGGGTALATGALSGGGGGGAQTQQAATPSAAPTPSRPAAAPASNPVGSGSAPVNQTPTFIGASATPENRSFGNRSLLGQ